MIRVNEKFFSNTYDATKYVMKLAAEGRKVEIREVKPGEALLDRLRQA